MEAVVQQSMADQAAVEKADSMTFEQFRQQYVAPERLGLSHAAVAPALAAV